MISCNRQLSSKKSKINPTENTIKPIKNNIIEGAQRTALYLDMIKNKRVALVVNQTSVIYKNKAHTQFTHLVDSLASLNVKIACIFSPEHGYKGTADAGSNVKNSIDKKSKIPIYSLHGKHKKPTDNQLKNIDLVIFDIQDVGVRYYTYLSTLQYIMESCAENKIPLILLDRPNPNGNYIDGPVLKPEFKSFLGLNPVPVVYGMTIGEYAKMINGEGWLKNKLKVQLNIIKLKNYNHQKKYHLSIKPSPNLPNDKAINLYPSLGFFEGTVFNAGRGTNFQFQQYGAPFYPNLGYQYIPKSKIGATHPKFENKICYGVDLRNIDSQNKINLTYLIDAFQKTPDSIEFFKSTFNLHSGNNTLKTQIINNLSVNEIKKTWRNDLETFKNIRKKYLIYP